MSSPTMHEENGMWFHGSCAPIYQFCNLLIAAAPDHTGRVRILGLAVKIGEDLCAVVTSRPWQKKGRRGHALQPCGTRASYLRGCRCPMCREANNAYWRGRYVPRPRSNKRDLVQGAASDGVPGGPGESSGAHE